jgi:hypothetical protein
MRSASALGIVSATCVSILAACGGEPSPNAAPPTVDEPVGVQGGDPALTCSTLESRNLDIAATGSWTPVRGAMMAPGSASIDAAAMCVHGGIARSLVAPTRSCARSLVVTIDTWLVGQPGLSFAVGVNGGWALPVVPWGAGTLQVCLGARAFEGRADLFLGMGTNPWLCPAYAGEGTAMSINQVSIGPDVSGSCPTPGTIPNGDFEVDDQSWTLQPGSSTAEVRSGIGENGSRAAHVATESPCENPSITGQISLPTASMQPNPALRVWSQGTRDTFASVRIGSLAPRFYTGATYIAGTGQGTARNICIPRWAQGTVQPIRLALVAAQYAEQCGATSPRDFAFDGLSFVSEPACASEADLFDGGFEQSTSSTTAAPAWALERYDDEPGSGVQLVVDSTQAHTGSVSARLSARTPCPAASLSEGVTVPRTAGSRGPALKFWYRTAGLAQTALSVAMNALGTAMSLGPASEWKQVSACLDPSLATRPDLLRFAIVSPTGGTCADEFPVESIWLDDVELTTDANCPAA